MRDKVLAYALAVSIGVHLIILCLVGKSSAAKPIDVEDLKLVRVQVVTLPAEARISADIDKPDSDPIAREHVSVPPPEKIKVAPAPKKVQSRKNKVEREKPSIAKLPGNPGGPLDLGSPSPRGEDLGPSGRTPVGWVPGAPDGTGKGSGRGPGVGRPEPVPNATEGPGREPAPPPPPPPPPDVVVKVCAQSGMLPGPNCESATTRPFRPGSQPHNACNVCRPKHVSTLADRSVPEMISGRKSPKYPESAMNNGTEGSVTTEYTINTEGNVTGVKVTSSSGSSDLDRAAVQTVESRKYKPAVQGGIPRNYRKRETFHFTLN